MVVSLRSWACIIKKPKYFARIGFANLGNKYENLIGFGAHMLSIHKKKM
jgi:hypothetical protein